MDACRQVEFVTSQQLGLRTIPSTVVDASVELAHRTGASNIMAVGCGIRCRHGFGQDRCHSLPNVSHSHSRHLWIYPGSRPTAFASTRHHGTSLDSSSRANTESTLVMDTAILTNIYRKKQSIHASQFEWMYLMEKATARKRHNC